MVDHPEGEARDPNLQSVNSPGGIERSMPSKQAQREEGVARDEDGPTIADGAKFLSEVGRDEKLSKLHARSGKDRRWRWASFRCERVKEADLLKCAYG